MSFDQPRLPPGFKMRPHHNSRGTSLIRHGAVYDQVREIAERLGIPYVTRSQAEKRREREREALDRQNRRGDRRESP